MDLQRDMQNVVKSRIQFTTADGDFEGVVRLICPVTKKMIIEQLLFLPKRLFIGVLTFNINGILSYKIINQSQINTGEQSPVFNGMHTKMNNELTPEIEIVSEVLPKEERYILKSPQWTNVILPTDSVILDCINEQFHQAVAHIRQQGSIGVYLGGPRIDRDGTLSWLSITTPNCIFLFDIQILKEKVFHEGGLKDVLQNPKIEKILHDCRNASDCLYHKFDTKLINVFDTQVADLFVTMQSNKKGATPQKVNTLNACLAKYLDVPNIFHPKIKHRSQIENVLHYSLRPLRNETRDLLIKNVVYLRLLKQRLNRLLLNPFHRAVEVYLQVVQGASDQEILLETPSEEDIPLQLVMGGLQTVRFRDPMLDQSSEHKARYTIENYTSLYKNNLGLDATVDTYNSSGFSKLLYQNEIDLATRHASHNTEYSRESGEDSKFNKIKNYIIDNGNSANFCKLPQVDIITRHTQHRSIGMSSENNQLSNVDSDECSGDDDSLSQLDINVTRKPFVYKNPERLGFAEGVMKEKVSICQVYNGDHPKVSKNNVKSASIPLSKISFFNESEKSKGLPSVDTDPYAKLRAAFAAPYDANNERKTELKFYPAGMANI